MTKKKIGIVLVATNSYFILAVRFIKRFTYFYKGDAHITFFVFSDLDPTPYLSENIHIVHFHTRHRNWREATNSKFTNILNLKDHIGDISHLTYFDADTNIFSDFTEDWFIGDLVGGEHYANRHAMKDRKNYDRNSRSKAYIPINTPKEQMYYYGAFFGGNTKNMMYFCKILRQWQLADKRINYEPGVNDESYINKYFHVNPPSKVVLNEQWPFRISDKGGLAGTRDPHLDVEKQRKLLYENKNKLIDIKGGEVIIC